jgi:hypothetical protein
MAAALALLLGGITLYLLTLVRRLDAVVKGEAPAPTTPLTRVPDPLCRAGCTCHGQRMD